MTNNLKGKEYKIVLELNSNLWYSTDFKRYLEEEKQFQ